MLEYIFKFTTVLLGTVLLDNVAEPIRLRKTSHLFCAVALRHTCSHRDSLQLCQSVGISTSLRNHAGPCLLSIFKDYRLALIEIVSTKKNVVYLVDLKHVHTYRIIHVVCTPEINFKLIIFLSYFETFKPYNFCVKQFFIRRITWIILYKTENFSRNDFYRYDGEARSCFSNF